MTTHRPRRYVNPRTGKVYPLHVFGKPFNTYDLTVEDDKWTDDGIVVDLGITEFDMPVEIKITRDDGDVLDKLYYPFQDVPPHRWYADYVTFLWERDIVKGPGEGKYGLYYPNDNITNSAFLKVLIQVSGNYRRGYPENYSGSVCGDADYGTWYYDYFMRAADLGWLTESACNPSEYTQRGLAAKLTALAHSGKAQSFFDTYQPVSPDFNDISPSHPNYKFIMYCKDHKIFEGYPSGYFAAGKRITRGEMSKVIFKAFLDKESQ